MRKCARTQCHHNVHQSTRVLLGGRVTRHPYATHAFLWGAIRRCPLRPGKDGPWHSDNNLRYWCVRAFSAFLTIHSLAQTPCIMLFEEIWKKRPIIMRKECVFENDSRINDTELSPLRPYISGLMEWTWCYRAIIRPKKQRHFISTLFATKAASAQNVFRKSFRSNK